MGKRNLFFPIIDSIYFILFSKLLFFNSSALIFLVGCKCGCVVKFPIPVLKQEFPGLGKYTHEIYHKYSHFQPCIHCVNEEYIHIYKYNHKIYHKYIYRYIECIINIYSATFSRVFPIECLGKRVSSCVAYTGIKHVPWKLRFHITRIEFTIQDQNKNPEDFLQTLLCKLMLHNSPITPKTQYFEKIEIPGISQKITMIPGTEVSRITVRDHDMETLLCSKDIFCPHIHISCALKLLGRGEFIYFILWFQSFSYDYNHWQNI